MNNIDFLPPNCPQPRFRTRDLHALYPVKSPSDWIVYSLYYNFSVEGPTVLDFLLLQWSRLLGQRRLPTCHFFVDVHRRSVAAFPQTASCTDDHVAHVGRRKFDDHWPWSCLRVCTWHAPSEPMTCHYVGALNGRCDSRCFVHNRQQLAGGVFPLL